MGCELYDKCGLIHKMFDELYNPKEFELKYCKADENAIRECEYRKVLIERDNLKKIIEEATKKLDELHIHLAKITPH